MKQLGRGKAFGKACWLLAVSALCVGNSFAQEVTPRLIPVPGQQGSEKSKQQPITREVNLSLDGTFRVAVVTRSGNYVAGARLTFAREPDGFADGIRQSAAADRQLEPVRLVTAAGGPSVVMGVKPGSYQIRVEVREQASEHILLVKASSSDSARTGQTLVLLPSPASDHADADCADLLEGAPGCAHRCWGAAALGGAALATAIALPLSLHRERQRASP